MAKLNRHKTGHPNFLHLGEMLHHVEDGMVAAYDWLLAGHDWEAAR